MQLMELIFYLLKFVKENIKLYQIII
jgi:hypothetical protein